MVDLVEVELDDELDDPGWTQRAARPPWTGRAWGRLVCVLAVVLAVGVVQGAAAVADRARVTSQAAVDLRVPREVQWSVDGALVGLAGDVVLVEGAEDSLRAYRWLDGLLLWVAPGVGDCVLLDLDAPAGSGESQATATRLPERTRVVCSRMDPVEHDAHGVAVIDPADGTWLAEQDAAAGTRAWAADGDRLYVVGAGAPADVTALALDNGGLLWREGVPEAVNGWYLTRDWLVLRGERRALDLRTGRPGEPTDWGDEQRHPLPGGATVVATWDPDGSFVTTSLLDRSGRAAWSRQAFYTPPAVTLDASVLPVVTLAGTIAGLDAASGEQLWSAALPGSLVAAVDGVLVCVSSFGSAVINARGVPVQWLGVDLRTGEPRWSVASVDPAARDSFELVTDGERFAVADGAGGVEIRDLGTGDVAAWWNTGVDEPSTLVPLSGSRVAQVTATDVVVLAP